MTLTVRNTRPAARRQPGRRRPVRRPHGAGAGAAPATRAGHHRGLSGADRPPRRRAGRPAAGHPPRPARPGRRWPARTAPSATVWVHPRIHPLTAVPGGAARSLDGRVDRVPHGTITFDSLREYVVGDELRRVHWRTSARVGELMVREQLDTSLPRLVVLLDDRAPPRRTGGGRRRRSSRRARRPRRSSPPRSARTCRSRCCWSPEPAPARRRAIRSTGSPRPPWRRATCGPPSTGCASTAPATRWSSSPARAAATELGMVERAARAVPAVLVGVLGPGEPGAGRRRHRSVVDAADGAEFAAAWDGARGW